LAYDNFKPGYVPVFLCLETKEFTIPQRLTMNHNRRSFLKVATLGSTASLVAADHVTAHSPAKVVRVLVWDERQPAQKEAYSNFLGNEIATHLQAQPGMVVKSACLDDNEQGITSEVLEQTDVLIWWGHQRQDDLADEKAALIVDRIMAGKLSLIALHSAHWSKPFVESMNARTRQDIRKSIKDPAHTDVSYIAPPERYKAPSYDTRITPYTITRKFPDGHQTLQVHMPNCCFPAFGRESQKSTVNMLALSHPIVKGIPVQFELPNTEMYDEPFHVPEPDKVILEERWPTGEWFRSGMTWQIGKGQVFYFRPGHELYPVYKQEWPLKIITNAVRWLAQN